MIRKFIYAISAIVLLATASCTNDIMFDDKGSYVAPSDSGFVTITLSTIWGQQTKGDLHSKEEETSAEGLDYEKAINNAIVIFCQVGKTKVVHAVEVSNSELKTANGITTTSPIRIGLGKYDVYVITNKLPCCSSITPGEDLNEKILNLTVNDFSYLWGYDVFMMYNAYGETCTIDVKSGNTIDNPAQNSTPIKLDRLANKYVVVAPDEGPIPVELDKTQNYPDIFTGKFLLRTFMLSNIPGRMYLNEKRQNIDGFDKLVPASCYFSNSPLSISDLVVNNSDMIVNYDALVSVKYYYVLDTKSGPQYNTLTYTTLARTYGFENNPEYPYGSTSGLTPKAGNTTCLVLSIFPEYSSIKGSDGLAGKDCFYEYNGEFFSSLESIQNKYNDVFSSLGSSLSLEERLKQAQSLINVYDRTDPTNAYKTDTERVGKFRRRFNIRVYENGTMFYVLYVKDSNYKNTYMVARNTLYVLNINKVLRIGTDVPGGWDYDPNAPVSGYISKSGESNSYNDALQFDVAIGPWTDDAEKDINTH
jgi:hypothetical protein